MDNSEVLILINFVTHDQEILNWPLIVAENCRTTTIEHLIIPHKASIVSDVVTVSIGVCVCILERLSDPMQFIDSVDKALYQAKNTSRNKVCSDIMNNTSNIIEFSALKD